jgi:hypothetical protein
MEGREAWASLCTALVDIGDPLEVPQLSRLPRSEHEGYIDLMTRYANQNSDDIQEIFVETFMEQVSAQVYTRSRIMLKDYDRTNRQFLSYVFPKSTLNHWTSSSLCSTSLRSVRPLSPFLTH